MAAARRCVLLYRRNPIPAFIRFFSIALSNSAYCGAPQYAELERNLISERTASALAHQKSHQRIYGPVPFGFAREADSLVVIHAEQLVVQRIRAWRDSGWSYRSIAAALNEDRVATKAGGGGGMRRRYARSYQTNCTKVWQRPLNASYSSGMPEAI